ncbi:MAG: response regulator [Alphaproteobacteria bacterium]|nr:response regulator [Alphaproteobacteria bacterium]
MSSKSSKLWPHGYEAIVPEKPVEPALQPWSPRRDSWWAKRPRKPLAQAPHDYTRILLVEPDAYHRRVLRMLLTSPSVSMIEVQTGEAAINLLGLKTFDLVIIDMEAPKMTGMATVRWIRNNPSAWSDIPVLGLIEESARDGVGRLMSDGMTDWTLKPIRRADLSEKLFGLMPALGDLSQPQPVRSTDG